jgi:hypothetical protein
MGLSTTPSYLSGSQKEGLFANHSHLTKQKKGERE